MPCDVAASLFDSITIGRYEEEFIDGVTEAKNPVGAVEQGSADVGTATREQVVSIGSGVPSLKAFQDNVFRIHGTLTAIAT